jgi:flagellar hook-associated protein 1 FlgK
MGSGIIGTGVSGLHAAQFGLQTTEHNIANANTPGYTRQRTIQASNPGLLTGAGFLGQGTRVATIERVYSRFMTEQVDRSQSSVSQLDSYYAQIKQIDNMLGDASAGLAPALQEFFSSVDQVAANPSQLATRQSMVSTAQALSARYQALGDQLAQMNDSINGEITGSVAEINSYAEQIATLNQQIGVAEASTGQPANDLQDSRDQLVFELNKRIKTTTTLNDDGSYNVFIGNGQQLVVGSHVMSIATTPSSSDPSRLLVGLKTAAGVQELPESVIKGGSLGGLLAFRSESLDRASNELGRNAVSLALTFNAQSALGQDLLGQSQLTAAPTSFTPQFFSVSAPVVTSSTTNPPGSPAVIAEFITPPPFNGNFYTDLGSSDYRLSSDGTSVTLTRLSDKKQWNGADLAAINTQLASDPQGFTLDPSPTLLAGFELSDPADSRRRSQDLGQPGAGRGSALDPGGRALAYRGGNEQYRYGNDFRRQRWARLCSSSRAGVSGGCRQVAADAGLSGRRVTDAAELSAGRARVGQWRCSDNDYRAHGFHPIYQWREHHPGRPGRRYAAIRIHLRDQRPAEQRRYLCHRA